MAQRQRISKVRLCLAASGGGHLRQLLDLKPFWDAHDVHFVTEDTPLAHSLAETQRVHLVPHFAFGQFRLKPFMSVVKAAISNIASARKAVNNERPELFISTGAGSVFFTAMFAKLRGAKFVLIESFARFERPSLFGRLARPFADAIIVQSKALTDIWPEAEVFDPFVLLDPIERKKEDLAVITVGTVMPFDRLVEGVGALGLRGGRPARIIAQVGAGGAHPNGIEARESIEFDEMMNLLERTKVLFCHGGTGSLITGLRAGCRIVAMPRRAELGEHYDNHQMEIVSAFARRGLVEVAQDAGDLQAALNRALGKQPQRATTDYSALVERLRSLVEDWFGHFS